MPMPDSIRNHRSTRLASQAMAGAGTALASLMLAACTNSALPSNAPSAHPTSASSTHKAATLHLVGIGDSIPAAGEGGAKGVSYVELYGDMVRARTGEAVQVTNLAEPPATSSSVLSSLQTAKTYRDAVAGADIITITVGGNDGDPFAKHAVGICAAGVEPTDCLASYAPTLARNLDGILTEIDKLRAGKRTVVRVTSPDYDPFIGVTRIAGVPAFPRDFGVAFYRQVAAAETIEACRVAAAHAAKCVDFFHAFNGPHGTDAATKYLAPDHLHPSALAQHRIAELLMASGLSPVI